MIVIDTSVLSAVFRRRKPGQAETAAAGVLRRMILEDWPLAIPGIVLQELFSGVRTAEEFGKLEQALAGFPVALATREEHVAASRISNACRAGGTAASTVDCLIAAQTIAAKGQLFTLDRDFAGIAAHAALELFGV